MMKTCDVRGSTSSVSASCGPSSKRRRYEVGASACSGAGGHPLPSVDAPTAGSSKRCTAISSRLASLSPMSPSHSEPPGPRAMSSQSVACTPGAVKTPIVQPWRSMAKKRAVSPLSLWVKTMSSRLLLATMPLDSAICGSWNVKSRAGAAAAPAGGSAAIASATRNARYTVGHCTSRPPRAALQVRQRVVALRPRRPDVADPVAVVVLGRALQRVLERPRLALVGPVLRVQAVGLAEVRAGVVDRAGAVQVLAELEV